MDNANISYSLGEYRNSIISALDKMRRDNIIARIWAKDYTVWKPAPDEITNRLGWLDAPAETLEKINYIRATLEPFTNGSINDVVLLGMGGSSLAAEVFNKIFGSEAGHPQLYIMDTTDPVLISQLTKRLDLEKTLFLVSSKSGSTLEVTSLFQYFFNLALEKSGDAAGSHFILITDEGSPMVRTAQELSLRHIFHSNPDIGGRYSALSLPGIVPAALIGVDVERLLQNAANAALREKTQQISCKLDDTGLALGATLGSLAQMGRDKLTLIMPERFASFGDWLEQLIAESTGKEGKGILPVTGEELSEPGSYGNDRMFVFFQNAADDNSQKIDGFAAAGHPVITIRFNDSYDLGGQMFIWEMAIAVAGHILNINPFIQPGVEAAKKYARQIIAQYRENKELPISKPVLSTNQCDVYGTNNGSTPAEALKYFLSGAAVNDYVCLQVYLSPTP